MSVRVAASRLPGLVRDASVWAAGSYVAMAANLLRGLVVARLLSPPDVGTLATVGMLLSYSLYADLGVLQAVGKEIPLAAGEGDTERAARLPLYGLGGQVCGTAVVALVTAGFVAGAGDRLAPELRFGLLTVCTALIFQGITAAQVVIFEAQRRFGQASALLALSGVGSLAAAVAGAVIAGVRGVLLAQAAMLAVSAAAGLLMGGAPKLFRPDRGTTRRLVRDGLPLAALLFGGYGLVYVDQVMVLAYLGREPLGIYTIVLYGGAALMLLPAAVARATSPRVIERYAEDPGIQSIDRLTWQPVRALAILLPAVIMGLWIASPYLITGFLPAFAGAVAPLRAYLAGAYFLGVTAGLGSSLVAMNRYRRNLPVVLGAIVLNVLVDVLILGVWKGGLTGAALGSGITYFAYWLAASTLVRWHFAPDVVRALLFNLRIGAPGLVLGGLALAAWRSGLLEGSHPAFELPAAAAAFALLVARRALVTGIQAPSSL